MKIGSSTFYSQQMFSPCISVTCHIFELFVESVSRILHYLADISRSGPLTLSVIFCNSFGYYKLYSSSVCVLLRSISIFLGVSINESFSYIFHICLLFLSDLFSAYFSTTFLEPMTLVFIFYLLSMSHTGAFLREV